MGARETSLENGYEMGDKAAETVSSTLQQEAESRLQLLAAERASQIGLELQRIADRTELLRSHGGRAGGSSRVWPGCGYFFAAAFRADNSCSGFA